MYLKRVIQSHLLALFCIGYIHLPVGTKSDACTGVYVEKAGMMLKSYDWHDGEGALFFNPEGLSRSAFPHESLSGKSNSSTPHAWQARYANLTFNQYGHSFPNGGINEQGLAMEVLWLDEAEAVPVDSRPYLNELEWVQHALDTCATVEEVISLTQILRISPLHGKLHYIMCDQTGDCATLEVLKGQLCIHHGAELLHPALTNHRYEESLSYLKSRAGSEPTERDSLSRFMTAAQLSKASSLQTLEEAVHALKRVEIKGHTQWQIGYELQTRRVAFKTAKRPKLREVSLVTLQKKAKRERDPCKRALTYDLSGDQVGDVSEMFSPPVYLSERSAMRRRLKRLKLSQESVDALTNHATLCLHSEKKKADH